MSLAESIFQKKINDLTIQDLKEFFKEEKEETSFLEFKSGELDIEKIYRSVCAFLNTDGGILILGAPKEMEVDKKRICIGELIPTKKIKSEATLAHLIGSHISPSPGRLNIKHFKYQEGFVFIIEVLKSSHPPHQVSHEGKYYIRMDKEAKAAPHGLVEALFKKISFPLIEAYAKIDLITNANNRRINSISGNFIQINFSFILINWSEFQNELDLNVRIIISKGIFFDSIYAGKIGYKSGQEYSHKVSSLLTYGQPVQFAEQVFINRADITNEDNEFRILISFFGKSSPSKSSSYFIDLNTIEQLNIEDVLKVVHENILVRDFQERNKIGSRDFLISLGYKKE